MFKIFRGNRVDGIPRKLSTGMDAEVAANAFIEAHLHFLDDLVRRGAKGDMLDTINRTEGNTDFTSSTVVVNNSNGARSFLLVSKFVVELFRETIEDPADLR